MPITSSAKKALRQNKKRAAHNRTYRNKIKILMKKALSLAREGNKAELEKMMPVLFKALDKATKRGVIKKNTASRRKARLAKSLATSQK